MPITLADAAKLQKDPLTRGVHDIFLMRNKLAQYIQTDSVDTMRVRDMRDVSLPTPSWRKLGGYFSESLGSTDWLEETIYSVGGYVDVDDSILRDKGLRYNPRTRQTAMWTKSMIYEFNDVLINGSGAGADQPDGIATRVAALATAQNIDAESAGAGTTDISISGGTPTTRDAFLDKLDQALYFVDNGDDFSDVVILTNTDFMLRFWSLFRRQGLIDTTQDQWGREVRSYKGAKIIDVGVKRDQSTYVVPTSSTKTTLYVCKMAEEFLTMLQYMALLADDVGMLKQAGTFNWRTVFRWEWGLSMPHPRGLVRLYNVKVS